MTDTAAGRQPALRKDAARNRRRIVEAARALVHDGKPVPLNAVAHAADVGVGTVYRHFPTPEALVEALATDRFTALIDQAEHAAAASDPPRALRAFLKAAVTAYFRDDTFAAAAVDPNPATPEVQALRNRLHDALRELLARTAADDALHPALTVADMMLLLCGVGFALRHAADRDDPALPDRYLNALLDGALTRHEHGG
ncbi:TetR/AcrR family transcriptional regulator [Pseudonocardia sp. MH-G8]|uniref:TetR/AcrR family transcriptional regulator n=1 Tax=Pseudonocardia sp. MH-G8 TaxID=1854588 RepID=UPI000BA117C5|nr:TetR/AcrR family transcriptional regulator [Pseudonocardia sp. MH-G8]OZM78958.1 TetR family transcriptional regulator [Pseudonocardia sp. MH-G8]